MLGWLRKVVGGAAGVPAGEAVLAQATSVATALAAKPVSSFPPAPEPATTATVFGVRRPMVAASGAVAGFEFSLPPALLQRLRANGDPVAQAAYQSALMASARPVLLASRRALLRVSTPTLLRPGWADQVPAGAMLLVDHLAQVPADLAQALRKNGARLGVPDGPPAEAPAADFVVIEATAGDIDTVLLSAQRWHEARPRIPRVATGLACIDDVERVLRSGFTLACGQLDRSAVKAATKPLNAAAHRVCELLNHLAMDRDTAVVAQAVRADVALSYRLLRYVNSPAIGLSRGVESVEHGVMVLGRNELQRWLSVMLMSAGDGRQATQALQEHALARGRFLELLALQQGEAMSQALFSVGMLSMLEVLLQCPLATAVAPLRLSAQASQALLQRTGVWAPYLELAAVLETDDGPALNALSARFGGADAVLDLAARAWGWAADVAQVNTGSTDEV